MDAPDSLATVVKRSFIPDMDEAFVYATWRNSKYYGTPGLKKSGDSKEIFRQLTSDIRKILINARVNLACLQDDATFIVGYAVYTNTHLNWVYVRDDYRKNGIATLLVPKNIETFPTEPTKIGMSILQKKNKENEEDGTTRDCKDIKKETENNV